jgi:hypothetical protein
MALNVVTAGDGQALALAYGEHIVAGHILLNKPLAPRALFLGLGRGTWDSAIAVWYNAEKLPSDAYRFHPGTLSTGATDAAQGIDSFYPSGGLTFNRMAYTAVRVPDYVDTVDPSLVIGRYRCLHVPDYDANGQELQTDYSVNPARVFADLWIKRAKRDPNRIDWTSWYDWKQFCDQSINWDDGKTPGRVIPRFQAHVVFTSAIEMIDAINLVTQLSATTWQDTGSKIVFYYPNSQTELFLFDKSVIVPKSVSPYTIDTRQLPSFARLRFRDLDSEFLAPAEWQYPLPESIDSLSRQGIEEVSFGTMHYSQAMRLASFYYKRSVAGYERVPVKASGKSFGVLDGDFVQIDHPATGGLKTAEVIDCQDLGEADGTRTFTLALGDRNFYSDLDHQAAPATTPVVV